jgi:hypothetical protein
MLHNLQVLVDEGGKAVLCDFGLSRIKANTTSRMTNADSVIAGSRNWMPPERKACRWVVTKSKRHLCTWNDHIRGMRLCLMNG